MKLSKHMWLTRTPCLQVEEINNTCNACLHVSQTAASLGRAIVRNARKQKLCLGMLQQHLITRRLGEISAEDDHRAK